MSSVVVAVTCPTVEGLCVWKERLFQEVNDVEGIWIELGECVTQLRTWKG